MKKSYFLAFLVGLASVLSAAAIIKQFRGVPEVQAAALSDNGPVAASSAAGYSIDWYTVDGGGGVASGSGYQMTASIGQPDAGTGAGGSFTLQGGFLPGTLQPWHMYAPLIKR